jgi:hypothetical protein
MSNGNGERFIEARRQARKESEERDEKEAASLNISMKAAQRAELKTIREQMDRMDPDYMFSQWDEVTVVHRGGQWRVNFVNGAAVVFWKYIDRDYAFQILQALDRNKILAFLPNPDCLVGVVSGWGLEFHVMDSALLMPVEPEQAPAHEL